MISISTKIDIISKKLYKLSNRITVLEFCESISTTHPEIKLSTAEILQLFRDTSYLIDFIFILSGIIVFKSNLEKYSNSTELKKITISEILKLSSLYSTQYSVKYINVILSNKLLL